MHLNNPFRDCQPKTRAALPSGAAVIDLLKFLEDTRLVLARDAWARISPAKLEPSIKRACGNLDRARVGEFDCVAGEIEQYLCQAALVPAPQWHAFADRGPEFEPLGTRQRLGRSRHRLDDLADRVVIQSERELAC